MQPHSLTPSLRPSLDACWPQNSGLKEQLKGYLARVARIVTGLVLAAELASVPTRAATTGTLAGPGEERPRAAAAPRLPGLVGVCYGNADWTRAASGHLLESLSPEFDSETGFGSSWSAMWEGELTAPVSAKLTLRAESNQRVKVQIAGKNLLDAQSGTVSGELDLVEGRNYPIAVYYSHQGKGKGGFRLEWSWTGHAPEVVPPSRVSHTAGQAEYWHWRPEPDPATLDRSEFARVSGKHVLVYGESGRFAGWPANEGLWSWGNEILVGFSLGHHKSSPGGGHAIDLSKPQVRVQARSLDGGETWTLEQPELPMDRRVPEMALPEPINFAHPDFALRCSGSSYLISYDRGRSWRGDYPFPKFPTGRLTSRTDYRVSGSNTCTVFLSAVEEGAQVGESLDQAFCARTTDGGLTWRFLGWMTGEPTGVRSVMPATVRVSDSHLVSVLRRRVRDPGGERPPFTENWIDAYESRDDGMTWKFLSRVGETDRGKHNGNPPAMVQLRDGRLVVAYGYRGISYGIRARISNDQGATWGEVLHLREDGGTWDFGYCRMAERPDGKLVTVYYYNTAERIEQHIAATIWNPSEARGASRVGAFPP